MLSLCMQHKKQEIFLEKSSRVEATGKPNPKFSMQLMSFLLLILPSCGFFVAFLLTHLHRFVFILRIYCISAIETLLKAL